MAHLPKKRLRTFLLHRPHRKSHGREAAHDEAHRKREHNPRPDWLLDLAAPNSDAEPSQEFCSCSRLSGSTTNPVGAVTFDLHQLPLIG
jgi:hypothetical protein